MVSVGPQHGYGGGLVDERSDFAVLWREALDRKAALQVMVKVGYRI